MLLQELGEWSFILQTRRQRHVDKIGDHAEH